jgi:hypothetical protein
MRKHLKSKTGQGTTEYIVILAIVVGLALAVFYQPIKNALNTKVGQVTAGIAQAGN